MGAPDPHGLEGGWQEFFGMPREDLLPQIVQHFTVCLVEQGLEANVAVSEVIDPDRSVGEHYPFFFGRRRGTERRRG